MKEEDWTFLYESVWIETFNVDPGVIRFQILPDLFTKIVFESWEFSPFMTEQNKVGGCFWLDWLSIAD